MQPVGRRVPIRLGRCAGGENRRLTVHYRPPSSPAKGKAGGGGRADGRYRDRPPPRFFHDEPVRSSHKVGGQRRSVLRNHRLVVEETSSGPKAKCTPPAYRFTPGWTRKRITRRLAGTSTGSTGGRPRRQLLPGRSEPFQAPAIALGGMALERRTISDKDRSAPLQAT